MENITTSTEQSVNKRKFWQFPWSYREGFTIALALLLAGFILEALTYGGIFFRLHYPTNVITLLVLVNIIFLLHLYSKTNRVIRWMSSVPSAVSSISLFVFLALLIGFIPQNAEKGSGFLKTIGASHVTTSIPFVISQLYLFITLGLVTIRRSVPFKGKNIGFFLNHAGLWITLVAASLGSGDLLRLQMILKEGGEYTNVAYNSEGKSYPLTIALRLKDFKMEEYNPKIAIVDSKTNEIKGKKDKNMMEVSKGLHTMIGHWNIYIKDFYSDAYAADSIYKPNNKIGSAPAAYLSVKNILTDKTFSGWISSGSFLFPFKALKLDNNLSLGMSVPEPKKFSSDIEYLAKHEKQGNTTVEQGKTTIEVNKPFKLNGWKIYQSSYESEFGKWSPSSTLDLVYDRWLPVVYFGILLLMAGAVYIFWMGRKLN